jgi:outer membrane protein insertion porin family
MRNRLFGVLALAGAALLGCAFATWGADVTFPIQITQISIEGNEKIPDRDVFEVVDLRVGDVLSEPADLKAASQAVFDLGWFSEVLPEISQDGVIRFRVVENPVVEKIEVTGNVNKRDFALFGVTLFSTRIMPTWDVRNILRENGVRIGRIFRTADLEKGLAAVVTTYNDRGYVLAMASDVKVGPTISIEVIEGRVAGSQISGLTTVPMDLATGMIDLPSDRPLRRADLQTVMTRLQESVYFSSVEVAPAAGPTRDSVYLDWTLTERVILATPVAVAIRSIELEGVTLFPEAVAARSVSALPDGATDNYAVLRAVEGLYNLYTHAGFLMVRFSLVNVEGDILRLRVDEGVVSEIVYGEKGTQTQHRVLEKMLEIRVGRILTRNDLRVSQQRLSALGYFDGITITPAWSDSGLRVSVAVTDKKTLGGMNGSLAFEPTTGGIVGDLTLKQRNVLGTGQDVSISYKRGISPEGKPETTTWELGYSTLATWSEFDRVSLDLYRRTQEVTEDGEAETEAEPESVSYLTLGGALSFTYPVADYASLVIGYRHDLERKETDLEWSPVDSISLALQEDSADDAYFPMRGMRRSATLEKAGGFAAGKEYTKLDLLWTRFLPVYDDLLPGMDRTWAIRFKAGMGDSGLEGAQAYEFGGPTTIRGVDSTMVQRMAIVNVEHRLRLTEGLVVTAFADAGMNLDSIRLGNAAMATGFELGITAAGMFVRLDVSWVLGEDASWTPRFDFGFGPMF